MLSASYQEDPGSNPSKGNGSWNGFFYAKKFWVSFWTWHGVGAMLCALTTILWSIYKYRDMVLKVLMQKFYPEIWVLIKKPRKKLSTFFNLIQFGNIPSRHLDFWSWALPLLGLLRLSMLLCFNLQSSLRGYQQIHGYFTSTGFCVERDEGKFSIKMPNGL